MGEHDNGYASDGQLPRGNETAGRDIDRGAAGGLNDRHETARAYVEKNGTPEKYRAQAEREIVDLLAVGESAQLDLFGYVDGLVGGRKRRDKAVRVDGNLKAAEALKNPTDPEAIRAGYGDGTRISSIIPALVRDPSLGWDIRGAVIKTPRDLAMLAQVVRTPFVETMKIALLNHASVVIHSEIVSVGSTSAALADPTMMARTLQKLKKRGGANRVLLSHNHPSGAGGEASAADVQVTRSFQDACIALDYELVDHVITNGEKYFSFRDAGLLKSSRLTARAASHAKPEAEGRDSKPLPLGEKAPWEVVKRDELAAVNHPRLTGALFTALKQVDESAVHVVYLSTKNTLLGLERVSGYVGAPDLLALKRTVFEGVGREAANRFMLCLPARLDGRESMEIIRDLRDLARNSNLQFVDAYVPSVGDENSGHLASAAGLLEAGAKYSMRARGLGSGEARPAPGDGRVAEGRTGGRGSPRAQLLGKLTRWRTTWAGTAVAARSAIDKALVAAIAKTGGSDVTGVPLRVAARDYVQGKGGKDTLTRRLDAHLRSGGDVRPLPEERALARTGMPVPLPSMRAGNERSMNTRGAGARPPAAEDLVPNNGPGATAQIPGTDPATLMAALEEWRDRWQTIPAAGRVTVLREAETTLRALAGPDLTGVPLRVAARGFIQGQTARELLGRRLAEHLQAIVRWREILPNRGSERKAGLYR